MILGQDGVSRGPLREFYGVSAKDSTIQAQSLTVHPICQTKCSQVLHRINIHTTQVTPRRIRSQDIYQMDSIGVSG